VEGLLAVDGEGLIEGVEVAEDVGIVVGIDDGDGLTAAVAGDGAVAGLESDLVEAVGMPHVHGLQDGRHDPRFEFFDTGAKAIPVSAPVPAAAERLSPFRWVEHDLCLRGEQSRASAGNTVKPHLLESQRGQYSSVKM